MASNRTIGIDNRLPWHLSEDLKYFKRLTMGKPIIMGRRTCQSLNLRPLPGRTNIVLTKNLDFRPPGFVIQHSIEAVFEAVSDCEEAIVIGGAVCFEQFFPFAERLYLTIIEREFAGDCFFPEYDETQWRQIECHDFPKLSYNDLSYYAITLERIAGDGHR